MDESLRGEQGPQGPSGPQGIMGAGRKGERGATGKVGERGAEGSRTKLPKKVLVAFVALALTNAAAIGLVVNQGNETITSLRSACEGDNALRVNQALGITDQIEQTERALKGSLGSLEPFREQIVAGLALRKGNLARIRATVADHPLTDRQALHYPARERSYREDCKEAFPR